LVVVYSIALGQYGALPFDQKQAGEIWLTAAQSLFAISLIINFEISIREAVALFILFISQVLIEFLVIRKVIELPVSSYEVLLLFSGLYIALGVGLLILRRQIFINTIKRTTNVIARTLVGDAGPGRAD
jgi:cation:H+ antiporter